MKQTSPLTKEQPGSVREDLQSGYLVESQLLDLLPSAACVCDAEGVIVNYNRKAADLWGRAPEKGQENESFCRSLKLYRPNGSVVSPEDSPITASLRDGQPRHDVEFILERPDHSRVCIEVSSLPVTDHKGHISGTINYFREITEPRSQQSRQISGEAFPAPETESIHPFPDTEYRNFIQSLPTPLYTTDKEGHITSYNDAAAELWGRSPRIGTDLWCGSFKMARPDGSDLPLNESPMAVCLKEQKAFYGEEILLQRPDGSLRTVLAHPRPLFNEKGAFTGALNMLIDITEHRETEKALRESERNYRNLAMVLEKTVEDQTGDLKAKNAELKKSEERYHKMVEEVEDYAIILLDKNGIVQNWNRGAEKIKGYKEHEIVGKSFGTFYLPEDREKGLPQQILKEAGEKGKAVYEGWRLRKDGTRFWGSIVITALHDDHHQLIGFSKVTRDLTERKLTEDKMREYTSQLEFQNKELEQFTYAASHDMKEPLRKIHLYNSAIVENAANTLDEKSKEFLKRSVNAARRMTNLIDDLLAYSRTTANIDSFVDVNLNDILDEIKTIHKEELEQKQVSIAAGKLPVVHAIPFQMTQMFSNIISNSIKYKHPDRDVHIQILHEEVKGSQIEQPDALSYRTYHKISVIDNGVGFDQQHAERIFNIFQRLHNNAGSHGSGIGLAICKRIVQNHHGFITSSGKEDEGAEFDIYLPK